jgi:hypothetical protein
MEQQTEINPATERLRFRVRCNAGQHGEFNLATDTLAVNIGQEILRDGRAQIWDSVVVECSEGDDGRCTVRVLLCNPDWEEPMEIACLRSNPAAASSDQVSLFSHLTSSVAS